MNAILIGFMGCGKTTTGRILSSMLKWRFIDTDDLVVRKTGMSIPEIFEKFGEGHFRRIESQVIRDISKVDRCVISLGGGAVLNEDNIGCLKKNGAVFYLMGSPETIMAHIGNSKERPLLNTSNPYETVKELLSKRHHLYEKNCDFCISIDGKDSKIVAEEIRRTLVKVERRK
ncbi:shikimate kinase [Caldanaerobius polysaccharolyticus]|uniref:shikimate kinase n=1 Tax=Caldanaerobius polysaccharolyticus TaxID=44256 RepID=UPI00068D2E4E|nr:shikimate kinase [Caldanaerobius polysaccharolyticus]